MNDTSGQLYQKVRAYSLDDPASSLPFSKRLARENGWRRDFARRVVEEEGDRAAERAQASMPFGPNFGNTASGTRRASTSSGETRSTAPHTVSSSTATGVRILREC